MYAALRAAGGLLPALIVVALPPLPTPAPHRATFVEGRVRDSAGTPIAGAQVTIVGTRHSALTDAVGRYRLAEVAAGIYTLRAAFVGYRAERREGVRIGTGGTVFVDFTLRPATVRLEDITVEQAAPAQARDEVSTGANRAMAGNGVGGGRREPWNTEEYTRIYDNRLLTARRHPLSTFSIDVDRASYSNVRRFLMEGRLPPADAVRTEEMVNYFTYDYAEPRGEHPFTVSADLAPAPWNPQHRLVRIGLQGRRFEPAELPPSNLVFLIDVSGSMNSPDKLPLVQQAFRLLANELGPEDRVAIVVYAGSAGLVLPPTSGSDRDVILAAIERLRAGGSTAGGAGIRLAYQVARQEHMRNGNNRVILATDGDFNVGVSSQGELVRLIEEKREQGTSLTVLGFGTGNLKDARMEQLADKGNGNYFYIDNLLEARKVFVSELTGTLFTIAKDVKIQVEFNPARVRSYRLVGYENRLLAEEDFDDDTRDAGELGAGHTVTALYEIVPTGAGDDGYERDLRYQHAEPGTSAHYDNEWLRVSLRYKRPQEERSRLLRRVVTTRDARGRVSGDFGFAASVAAFAMVLRNSEYRGSATFDSVLELARANRGTDTDGYRAEFIRLVELARNMEVAVGE